MVRPILISFGSAEMQLVKMFGYKDFWIVTMSYIRESRPKRLSRVTFIESTAKATTKQEFSDLRSVIFAVH